VNGQSPALVLQRHLSGILRYAASLSGKGGACERARPQGDRRQSELAAFERWPKALDELHARIVRRFLRPEVKERAYRYLARLLGRVERKRTVGRWLKLWESADLGEPSAC
jgi:hypothetical protein